MFLNVPKKAKSLVAQWRSLVSLVRRIRVQIPPSPLVVTIERERDNIFIKDDLKRNHQSHRSVLKVDLLRIMMFHNPPGVKIRWDLES